jgi:hypothetical protein
MWRVFWMEIIVWLHLPQNVERLFVTCKPPIDLVISLRQFWCDTVEVVLHD